MNLNELFIQSGLYNLNSSESDRRKKIEAILLKGRKDNEDNDDDEIPDDDMINQYIRRSDVTPPQPRKSTRSSPAWTRNATSRNANSTKAGSPARAAATAS